MKEGKGGSGSENSGEVRVWARVRAVAGVRVGAVARAWAVAVVGSGMRAVKR